MAEVMMMGCIVLVHGFNAASLCVSVGKGVVASVAVVQQINGCVESERRAVVTRSRVWKKKGWWGVGGTGVLMAVVLDQDLGGFDVEQE